MMLQIGFTQVLADYSSHILDTSHIQLGNPWNP